MIRYMKKFLRKRELNNKLIKGEIHLFEVWMNLCQYSGHLKCDFYAAQGAIL